MYPDPFDKKSVSQAHCAYVQRVFSAYLDDTLNGQDRQALQAHLEVCSVCRQELSVWQQSEQTLRQARQTVPPAGDLRAGFYARLAAEDHAHRRKLDWRLAFPVLAACGLLIGLLNGRFVRQTPAATIAATPPQSQQRIALSEQANIPEIAGSGLLHDGNYGLRLEKSPLRSNVQRAQSMSGKAVTLLPMASVRKPAGRLVARSVGKVHSAKLNGRTVIPSDKSRLTLAPPTGTDLQMPYASGVPALSSHPDAVRAMAADTFGFGRQTPTEGSKPVLPKTQGTKTEGYQKEADVRPLPSYLFDASSNRTLASQDARAFGETAPLPNGVEVNGDVDGVHFEVRDTQRGFTSTMHLASQVEKRNGKQVVSIHLEDKDNFLDDSFFPNDKTN